MISEKKNKLLTDLEGKNNLARKCLRKKISCTEKKNYIVICLGKRTVISRGLGKKFLTKSPISPSKVKWLAPKGEMAKRLAIFQTIYKINSKQSKFEWSECPGQGSLPLHETLYVSTCFARS